MTLPKRVVAAFSAALFLNFAWADVNPPKNPAAKENIQLSNKIVTEKLVLTPIKTRKPIFQNELRANSCTSTECCCVADNRCTARIERTPE